MASSISLRIPEDYQTGLAKIISLNDESVNEIISILENEPINYDSKKMIESSANKVKTTSLNDAEEIIGTIYSLYELKNHLPLSESAFIDIIADAMNSGENNSLKLANENLEEFKQKLSAFLNVNSLSIRTKAGNIRVDHNNILKNTSLITDIRPVFGNNVDDLPLGMVLVHTLKIVYEQNDELKKFYVALDDNDLTTFINSLKRAQNKSESLRKFTNKVGLQNLDIR